ncbi:MAG: hypothetical protein KF849_07720 [Rhizobiaceae bacterium]|nr:hypothetical protein [Rhizobiaceae bacterium]
MGIVKPGAGIALMAAFAAVALAPESPVANTTSAIEPATAFFKVLDRGLDTGCELALAQPGADGRLPVLLGSACSSQEAIAGLRYWSDREDGTVELSDESGEIAMRLAAGDGSAFEAFGSGAPLIMLVASQH